MYPFFEANVGSNLSWTWRSILEGRKILMEGARWRTGNRRSVRIDVDPWLPKSNRFRPIGSSINRGKRGESL